MRLFQCFTSLPRMYGDTSFCATGKIENDSQPRIEDVCQNCSATRAIRR